MATSKKIKGSFSRSSEEDYSLVCLPCHRDEATVPAHGFCTNCQEHLCRQCFNHHKRATLSRHHKLQDKDTMPATQQLTDTVIHHGTTDNLTTPCPHHKKEMLKLYCHDHKLLLCSICVAREHTKSCHVDYIPDVSNKMIDSQDYKHTIDRMDKLMKKCTTIEKETSRSANKSKDSLTDALKEIIMYRESIIKRIDQLQKTLEDKITALQQQNDKTIKSVKTNCEHVTKSVKMAYDNIKQLNSSKQGDLLFIEIKQAERQLHDYEKSITSWFTGDCNDGYKFVPSHAIDEALQKEKMLGDVSANRGSRAGPSASFNPTPSSADDTIIPTHPTEICVKSSKDKNRCWITGMISLSPDRLILADYYNNSIKLVDVNSKSIISHLSLGTEDEDAPWDITSTTSTQVAVTVPDRQHIQNISVSNNNLNKTHTIQTDGKCYGICCHQDKLIVTYRDPGKLEILDMKGRVITRVDTDSTGEDIFDEPAYVQANSSYIYVCDRLLEAVTMLNWSGEIIDRIKGVVCPRGMSLLGDGRLLVCDWDGDRVYQVSGSTTSRIVLQDVTRPYAVCVDAGEHKLYISRRTLVDDKLDNNILVYNI